MVARHLGRGRPALILLGAGLFAAAPAAAGERSPGAAAVLACRAIADASEQLACFRRASEVLAAEPAETRAEPGIGPTAAAPPPARRPFGAPKPRPVRAARPKAPRTEDALTVRLTSLSDRGDGRMLFHFDDGSTWTQTQTDEPIAGALRPGDQVTLRRSLFSGYVLDIPGRTFVRVARVGGD